MKKYLLISLILFCAGVIGHDTQALAGSISGTVYAVEEGSTQPVPLYGQWGIKIYDVNTRNYINGSPIQENGTYSIIDIPAGSYKLSAEPSTNHVSQYYNNALSFDAGETISIDQNDHLSGYNFTLELGGIISGTVYEADGVTLIHGNWGVKALKASDYKFVDGSQIDSDGTYSIKGLPTDSYIVYAIPSTNHIPEYYDNVYTPNNAHILNLTVGQSISNIDFYLDMRGVVSGHVKDESGAAIPGVHVYAKSDSCDGVWLNGAETDGDGNFEIKGLPGGTVYVNVCPSCNGQDYVDEWYDGGNGIRDCNHAAGVEITVGSTTTLPDTVLQNSEEISGSVTGTGVVGIDISVHDWDSNEYLGGMRIESEGEYTLTGLAPPPSGKYHVYLNSGDTYYLWEEYPDPVTPGQTGIDFTPEKGGRITGQVINAEDDQPVADIWVMAHHYDQGDWANGANTDASGVYTIGGISSGDYRIQVDTSGMNLLDEFYDETHDWHAASRVAVTANNTTENINMSLDYGFSHDASVRNLHQPDNTFETAYSFCPYDFDGNLPDDIQSVTVTTPNNTLHNLIWDSVWEEFSAEIPGSPEPGVHVFTATMAGGHKVISTDYQYVVQSIRLPT